MKISRRFALGLSALALAAGLAALVPPAEADEKAGGSQLKFGTLAPDNTPWSDILKNFKKNLQKETKGKLRVQLYLNGVLGDEAAMLQKMKFGQLTGGGFSTGGISTVVPELQVFEVPFLFNTDEEADHVMDNVLLEDMRKACEDRGLFLYIWAVNGWHDIGHKSKPVFGIGDVKGEKAHMQETDIQKAFWTSCGANPVPIAVPEVLGALQRGMIDCFSTTPIFASAAQWFTQVKHWSDTNHIYQPAAVVFDRKWWDGLDDGTRKTILGFAPDLQAAARKDVRGIDKDLFEEFKKNQIEIHTLTAAQREEFRQATAGIGDELVKKGVFSKAILERARKGLQDFRAKKGAAHQ